MIESKDWQEQGTARMSRRQQNLLCAACNDLADNLRWHGIRLDGDSFRHLISATVLGERLVPGINTGMGAPGLVRLARSSKELSKSEATQAIRIAFDLGDFPEDQGLQAKPIRWGVAVTMARWITEEA